MITTTTPAGSILEGALSFEESVGLYRTATLAEEDRIAVGLAVISHVCRALPKLGVSRFNWEYFRAYELVTRDEAAARRGHADALLGPIVSLYTTVLVRRWRTKNARWVLNCSTNYYFRRADFSREALAHVVASTLAGGVRCSQELSLKRLGLVCLLLQRAYPSLGYNLGPQIVPAWLKRVRQEGLSRLTGVFGRVEKDDLNSLEDLERWVEANKADLLTELTGAE